MKILVADAHAQTRAGLAAVAEGHDCLVVAQAADGPSALRAYQEWSPDIALLGVDLPGCSGAAMATSLSAEGGHTIVVAGMDVLAVVSRAIMERQQDEAGRLGSLLDALAQAGISTAEDAA